ncbi:iron-containing alcohol dehydrogenase [Sphingomonas hengshuiensis]|uniref:Alcohol dehydrogenase n=1 Tax=Sphingomonas hengshuiensis TaxID=1609977 RepID=A0A7U4LFV9_9SPHN|nr:iron-containing alcohol dehydrogenase [Sphingomonas hengshuiensis]AJP72673.1 alcohol dehydrogenase [Sphingomonas hengshuiensis]
MFGALRLPRNILFGRGQRAALGSAVARLGRHALLCTDPRQAAQPEFEAMLADLAANGVETFVFQGVIPDLPLESIAACVGDVRHFPVDVVVGIGGGSSIDLAKVVAVLLTHGGVPSDYYGEFAVPGPVMPLVAVPTTAGTGSEVTPVAVVSDTERGLKIGIASPHLIPQIAICDPELTVTCPPVLTAVSGSDALTHAVEAFTTLARPIDPMLTEQHVFVGKNALSDHFARLAIANLFRYLERAFRDGSDLEARDGVMLAALAAGCAFGTAGTAAAHALQYPVGNLTHTAHGAGVATLLPYVMQYNRPACAPVFAELADLIGVGSGGADEKSQAFIDAVADLLAKVEIPATLAALGLTEDQQDFVAENSLNAARLVKNNPRPLDLTAMQAITRAAFTGDRRHLATL